MKIEFNKYQGAGNDFVMIDNRNSNFQKNKNIITKLCHRNFGIGADGLILLENDDTYDFKMVFYNSDGNESTMCGNGGRCLVGFAHQHKIFDTNTTFNAIDGIHHATIKDNLVSLQMINIKDVYVKENYCFLNTGSPHHVQLVTDVKNYDVYTNGKHIRNELYGIEGSNVNFVEKINNSTFRLRTYERGVEDETLACGTGATAVAIAMHKTKQTNNNNINILVEGGELNIKFDYFNNNYTSVFLTGPYENVFSGIITI